MVLDATLGVCYPKRRTKVGVMKRFPSDLAARLWGKTATRRKRALHRAAAEKEIREGMEILERKSQESVDIHYGLIRP